ncbi:hypothetical protein [Mucilaginibacter antarcticus]|uniref:Uncharacterized protein n=1 Tax=Mucilaginibacter antarcticus TaxID=1855725 RepID=A0ABW5XTV8_9SPHI
MKILKSKSFLDDQSLTAFVIESGITREDIFAISTPARGGFGGFVLFFYSDQDVKEKESKGFWG